MSSTVEISVWPERVVVEAKDKILSQRNSFDERITLGEIDTLFGDDELSIPFDLVDDVGEINGSVKIGRIGITGEIVSLIFDCLLRA